MNVLFIYSEQLTVFFIIYLAVGIPLMFSLAYNSLKEIATLFS